MWYTITGWHLVSEIHVLGFGRRTGARGENEKMIVPPPPPLKFEENKVKQLLFGPTGFGTRTTILFPVNWTCDWS